MIYIYIKYISYIEYMIYIYIHIYIYIYVYIYIYNMIYICMYVCMYVYIYIYIEREREREKERGRGRQKERDHNFDSLSHVENTSVNQLTKFFCAYIKVHGPGHSLSPYFFTNNNNFRSKNQNCIKKLMIFIS